jgi:uncharacterized membrane protein YecN with MAPEG domain
VAAGQQLPPPNPAPSASAFVCLLPEHVRKVEDEDERRKRLLCRLVLPFLALFHLICLSSPPISVTSATASATTVAFSFFEFLCATSLAVECALLANVACRRDAYWTSIALALWCNFTVLSACFHYGFVSELFCVLACMPPLLFFVFGGRVGVCAFAVVLLEGALFPLVEPLVAARKDLSLTAIEARQPLQLSHHTSLAAALLVAYVVGLSAWLQDSSRAAYRDKMRAIVLQSEAANRELQQATAAKSNFLANMSHGTLGVSAHMHTIITVTHTTLLVFVVVAHRAAHAAARHHGDGARAAGDALAAQSRARVRGDHLGQQRAHAWPGERHPRL